MIAKNPTRVAIYRRISADAEGLALGVERQREDLLEYAAAHGLTIVAEFTDNDFSASTRARRRRPDFDRMIAEAARPDRRFDALLSYTASRLTRRPAETEVLIQLAETTGLTFYYRNSPAVDLNTADGRAIARILAAQDAAEAERTGERVSRTARQRAEKGQRHGGWLPTGYTYTYDQGTPPRVVGVEIDGPRAALVREAAERVLAGEPMFALARDFNRRDPYVGPAPSARAPLGDGPWISRSLRRVLITPTVAGLRRAPDGSLHMAEWPAIIDRDTWDALVELITDPGRRSNPGRFAEAGRRYVLSGLLRCAYVLPEGPRAGQRCAAALSAHRDANGPLFVCSSGSTHVRITYGSLESYVLRQLVARLDSPELRTALDTAPDTSTEQDRLRTIVERARTALDDLADERDAGDIGKVEYRARRVKIEKRRDDARTALASLAGNRGAGVASGADLADRLATATVEQARTLVGEFVERVDVGPHPAGLPTHGTRRRGEDAADFAAREQELRERLLVERVRIEWNK